MTDLGDLIGKQREDGKKPKTLGPAPAHDAPIADLRAYLHRAYGLPEGYAVDRVVRHGGRALTAVDVHIRPPGGGKPLRIHYEEERQCRDAVSLRGRAAGDTDGLTRGDLITGKAAQSVYEALCSLADTFERSTDEMHTWEWVQQLLVVAEPITGLTLTTAERYDALERLREHRYSRRTVQDPDNRAAPAVLVDREDGARYVPARHLSVFVRFELGVDPLPDDRLLSRMTMIGGSKRPFEQWNVDRTHKPRLVLYQLPQDDPASGENHA
jgi:hypothetical protein